MPLQVAGFASRREMIDPEPPKVVVALEQVLKFNPNHDPANGRFTSGGGGRRGGTMGAPTEDAFGNPLKGRGAVSARGTKHRSVEAAAAAALSGGGRYSTQGNLDSGFHRGGERAHDPHFDRGASYPKGFHTGKPLSPPRDPNFHQGEGDPELAGTTPYRHTSGIFSPSKFTPETLAKNYTTMMGHPPSKSQMDKVKSRFAAESQRRYREGVKAYRKALQHPGSLDKSGQPTKRSTFS